MKRSPTAWIPALLALMLATACGGPPESSHARFAVFGTEVTTTLREADHNRAEQALARLGRDFQRMHRQWHPWKPGALTDLNRDLQAGRTVRADEDLVELLEASQEMERRSGGRFNAAIGKLIELWGFHTSSFPLTEPPPDDDEIALYLARRPSALDIEVSGNELRSDNRHVQLDFSGIAKGLAARLACSRLADFRITDALINLGGDVMACGRTDRPWRVAVRDPQGGVLTHIELARRMAVFTSGNYHRYGEFDGERYAHILHPHTGYPVDEILQVTVIDDDPVLADAAATALVVAGPDAWRAVARNLGVERVLVIDAEGTISATETLERLIETADRDAAPKSP